MIAQVQFLNALLTTKDKSLLTLNNINEEFFSDYKDEYNYIKTHIDKYNSIPDKETFVDRFPNFDIINVTENTNYLIDALFEDKNKRFLANSFNKVRTLLQGNNTEEALNLVSKLSEQMSSAKHLEPVNILTDVSRYDEYISRCTNFKNHYVTTGLPELDQLIGGWDRKEEYATIVARTNMGKTWLLLLAAKAAAQAGLKVGIFSGEMSVSKVGYRVDTLASHISNSGMTHGDVNIQDNYRDYINNIKSAFLGDIWVLTPDHVDGPCGVNAMKAFIEKCNLDILFIDQHSLLEDDRKAKDPVTRASNISKDIKLLQVHTRIPIITVSQQNRSSTENGIDNTHIAQSDRIGQDSTTIIFFENKDGIASLYLTKARDASNSKKLSYAWDINKGIFTYIPTENSGVESDSQECENLRKEYDECDEGTEEF